MSQYEHSLVAMKRLLDAVGESHWAKWIETDITEWRLNGDPSRHLSAYGGMGSFNDIWIRRSNQHTVTESQEPWANALFECLKSLCHFLAQHANETFTATAFEQRIGRHDSALAAFVGGTNAPASMRGHATAEHKLRGWRCLRCGHAEVSGKDLDNLIAQAVVPAMVFESCERMRLDKLVDRVLARKIPNLEGLRNSLITAVNHSGIELRDRDGWMRPCPQCGKNDTAVYRWRVTNDDGLRLQPATDNLPMRKRPGWIRWAAIAILVLTAVWWFFLLP